jgi:Ca2+-binding RTX toxin-like protein
MAHGIATIVGGDKVILSLGPQGIAAAQFALDQLGLTHKIGHVLNDTSKQEGQGVDVYNIHASEGATYTLPHYLGKNGTWHTSNDVSLVLFGSADATIVGTTEAAQREILIGNAGNDTITTATGHGVIITGNGDNLVNTGTGKFEVILGSGSDTLNAVSGSDKITADGSATVYGHAASINFTATHGNDSVVAGRGAATLYAGSGKDVFVGGSAKNYLYSGAGSDTFIAGSGKNFEYDTGKGGHTVFDFTSQHGGSTTYVYGFDPTRDSLQLTGYSTHGYASAEAMLAANSKVEGGNTVVTLEDHTKIILVGFTGFKPHEGS